MLFDEELDSVISREKRFKMVEEQIRLRSIHDKRVLETMKRVPRHFFFPEKYQDIAYGDHPIPIGYGQSSNQPFMIALMMQFLELRPLHQVLEIGTGSAYQTALLAEIATKVYTVEKRKELHDAAVSRLKEFGYQNVEHSLPKKVIGWQTKAPFDRVIVTGVLSCIPKELIKQMAPKSVMVCPIMQGRKQELVKVIKTPEEISVLRIAQLSNLAKIDGHTLNPIE
ncbi:MAG: protein-L-isoaspartate O-methyltransferase family protein [Candidatus Woesearchaeota archaeon]